MRHHFAGRTRDTYGNVQIMIPVSIYYSGTASAAPICATFDGASSTTTPQVSSNSFGYFDFYVDDTEVVPTSLFDVVCQSVTYSKIDIFKGAWFSPKKYFLQ
jgi:hypothetical protein